MDRLWSPWRYTYVQEAQPENGCVFCRMAQENCDAENYILHRAKLNFVVLNLYPYCSGHLMVVPYRHVDTLERADGAALTEMMHLTQIAESHLRSIYRAGGVNIGMNIGACAGAGVAGHIHMHVLPRWLGDANFMTTAGETRVMPEPLSETYRKLKAVFE